MFRPHGQIDAHVNGRFMFKWLEDLASNAVSGRW
jgi:hypothetical protein